MKQTVRRSIGFTLIELVSVMVILGIIAVVVLPRFASVNVFESRGFFEQALSAVRYAHKLAVASGCSIEVRFSDAAESYTLSRWSGGGDCTQRSAPLVTVERPGGGGSFNDVAPAGVDVGNDLLFYFDRVGRPHSASGALITAPASLRVDIDDRRIQVVPQTGLVLGQ